MGICKLCTGALVLCLLFGGCRSLPASARPDLVVSEFELDNTKPSFKNADGSVTQPITFTVLNKGNTHADIFKIGADYYDADSSRWCYVPLFVTGHMLPMQEEVELISMGSKQMVHPLKAFSGYPVTRVSLYSGSEFKFSDCSITFKNPPAGKTLAVRLMVDTPASDEGLPPYGRVEESNENNNYSESVQVTLP